MGRPSKISSKNSDCNLKPTVDTVKRAQELLKIDTKRGFNFNFTLLAKPAIKVENSKAGYLCDWNRNKLIRLVNQHFDYYNEIAEAYELRLVDYLARINKQREIDFDCYFIKEGKVTTQATEECSNNKKENK